MTQLPIEFRYRYLKKIEIQIVLTLCIFIVNFASAYLIKENNFWFPCFILCIVYIIGLHHIKLENVRSGFVISCANHNCKAIVDSMDGESETITFPTVHNATVGDCIYIYDRVVSFKTVFRKEIKVPIASKKNIIIFTSENSKYRFKINDEIGLDAIPTQIKKYCTWHFIRRKRIESIQIQELFKVSVSVTTNFAKGNRTIYEYFYVFKTKSGPITISCMPLVYNFYKPGDLFYLVKLKHEETYIPIAILDN